MKFLIKGDELGYISDHDDQSYGMFCPVALISDKEAVESLTTRLEAAEEVIYMAEKALRSWEQTPQHRFEALYSIQQYREKK